MLLETAISGGLALQVLNIKVILYGITIYTSFSPILTGTIARTISSVAFLSALGFAFNAAMAMAILLLYSALLIALH